MVNVANNDGKCPLHIAAINNNVEMCKVFFFFDKYDCFDTDKFISEPTFLSSPCSIFELQRVQKQECTLPTEMKYNICSVQGDHLIMGQAKINVAHLMKGVDK